MAGNSIAIPAVGCILAVLFAATEPTQQPSEPVGVGAKSVPTWIGIGRVAERAGKYDSLFGRADHKRSEPNPSRQQTMDGFLKRRKV